MTTRCGCWRARGRSVPDHERAARAAESYLAMRRTLGFKLTTQGRTLMRFVAYCEAHHADHITADLALAWAIDTPRSSDEVYWSRRLMVVRIFARHLQTLDPATEIPPPDVLPHHKRRITPYLYSPQEIAALLEAADTLAPPLRAATWRTRSRIHLCRNDSRSDRIARRRHHHRFRCGCTHATRVCLSRRLRACRTTRRNDGGGRSRPRTRGCRWAAACRCHRRRKHPQHWPPRRGNRSLGGGSHRPSGLQQGPSVPGMTVSHP